MPRRGGRRVRRSLPTGHVDAFGSRIELALRPRADEVRTVAHPWCDVGSFDFAGRCPLCAGVLARSPSGKLGTGEHVPPFAVGGIVRTRTCPDCNAGGSRSEAELVRWWSKEYPARFATPRLPGSRVGGGVLLRGTTDGKFALIVSGSAADGVHDVLATAGTADSVFGTFTLPTDDWMIALLKSAYLAACIFLREIPMTPDAEHARQIIRSSSFGVRGATVGVRSDAVPFRVFRIYDADASDAQRIWVGVAMLPWAGMPSVPVFGIGLGQVGFVTWPIPDRRAEAVSSALRQRGAA